MMTHFGVMVFNDETPITAAALNEMIGALEAININVLTRTSDDEVTTVLVSRTQLTEAEVAKAWEMYS